MIQTPSLFCRTPTHWFSDPSLCWFEWQSLVAGIFAVLAAVASIYFLQKQIDQSDRQEDRRRSGNLSAARAMLPLAIVDACQHAEDTCAGLLGVSRNIQAGYRNADDPIEADFSPPPQRIFDVFTRCIEWSDDQVITEMLSEIISIIQVLYSRISSVSINPRSHRMAINDYILQCAIIESLSVHLLPYARREVDVIDQSLRWDDVRYSLQRLRVTKATHPEVFACIERRESRGSPPMDFLDFS